MQWSGVVKNNKLVIAAAGSGKTTMLVKEALSIKGETILIATYTESNKNEIINKITKEAGSVPPNITVITWFSFLLKHGVRPYQSVFNQSLHDKEIGFYLTNAPSGAKLNENGEAIKNSFGYKIYWTEKDNFKRYYFTSDYKIFSDKISRFVFETNKKSKGAVFNRITSIFDNIYIDEVQDLAGFDLEIIKLLFKAKSNIVLVGDPRQVTYKTHHTNKHKEYSNGKIRNFAESEKKLGKTIKCEVDTTTLKNSHRNNQQICDYSSKLYPSLPSIGSCNCEKCQTVAEHQGVFIVPKDNVERYLSTYNPVQLRWNASTKVDEQYSALNFGESKGMTMERVLIYPTQKMIEWIKNNRFDDDFVEARAKLYVALTRATCSSAIVMDDCEDIAGVEIFR